ncbi:hypothetical protein DSECCO2_653780 [anaerobic digester metagenome]
MTAPAPWGGERCSARSGVEAPKVRMKRREAGWGAGDGRARGGGRGGGGGDGRGGDAKLFGMHFARVVDEGGVILVVDHLVAVVARVEPRPGGSAQRSGQAFARFVGKPHHHVGTLAHQRTGKRRHAARGQCDDVTQRQQDAVGAGTGVLDAADLLQPVAEQGRLAVLARLDVLPRHGNAGMTGGHGGILHQRVYPSRMVPGAV